MIIGYARVSTKDQSTDVQVEQLKALGCEKIFMETVSGKEAVNRPELQKCIEFARQGDTVIVMKVDRLARNTRDAIDIADQMQAKGVGLKLMDLGDTDINSDLGRVIYNVMATFAEMERKRIVQRANEGRAKAKADGKHLGRHADTEQHERIKEMFRAGQPKAAIAKELGVSRTTVYRVLDGVSY